MRLFVILILCYPFFMAKAVDSAGRALFAALVVGAVSKIAQKGAEVVFGDQKIANDLQATVFSVGMIGIGAATEEKAPEFAAASITLGVAGGVGYLAMREEIALGAKVCANDRLNDGRTKELVVLRYDATGNPVYGFSE